MIIFGHDEIFRSAKEVADLIKTLLFYRERIQQPQVIVNAGRYDLFGYYFVPEDSRSVGPHMIDWLYEEEKVLSETKNYLEVILKCTVEDKNWASKRNKGLEYLEYKKVSFLPEIQEKLILKLDEYLAELKEELAYRTEMEEAKERERKARYDKWTKSVVYEYRAPRTGEEERYGYLDADYVSNETGHVVRMVNRSVFDAGADWYPKRLEMTKDAFNKDVWTAEEMELSEWMREFADFR